MSERLWADIRAKMESHAYMQGIERTIDRVRRTGEHFTPTDLVLEMVSGMPLEDFGAGRTVLDPACGDGQFLVAAKWIKVFHHGMSEAEALADIYGIDIMADNVAICRQRLGGGTIVVGDALQPDRRVDGQTEQDHDTMQLLFGGRIDVRPRAVQERLAI